MNVRLLWICCLGLSAAVTLADQGPARTNAPATLPPTSTAVTTPITLPTPGVALPTGAKVAVVRLEGFIYGYTLQSLEQRSQQAIDRGATLIVVELDTPGGLVSSALDVSRYIKSLPVRTVAWVNDQALSAGILIASACDQIVMAPASLTGDCAPIVPGQNLAPTERAKALSPILEEFRDSAPTQQPALRRLPRDVRARDRAAPSALGRPATRAGCCVRAESVGTLPRMGDRAFGAFGGREVLPGDDRGAVAGERRGRP